VTLHIPENILILADWRLPAIADDTMPPRDPNDDDEEDEEGQDEEGDDEPPVVREPEPEEPAPALESLRQARQTAMDNAENAAS
jgi:hypothetical protein